MDEKTKGLITGTIVGLIVGFVIVWLFATNVFRVSGHGVENGIAESQWCQEAHNRIGGDSYLLWDGTVQTFPLPDDAVIVEILEYPKGSILLHERSEVARADYFMEITALKDRVESCGFYVFNWDLEYAPPYWSA